MLVIVSVKIIFTLFGTLLCEVFVTHRLQIYSNRNVFLVVHIIYCFRLFCHSY